MFTSSIHRKTVFDCLRVACFPVKLTSNVACRRQPERSLQCSSDIQTTSIQRTSVVVTPPIGQIPLSVKSIFSIYGELSKKRLSMLVTSTALFGYFLAPGYHDLYGALAVGVGTMLVSASANTFNQVMESPFDAQMERTRKRPIVRGAVSTFHAFNFGVGCFASGMGVLLCHGLNISVAIPAATVAQGCLPASLAGFNVFLYSILYTRMKRTSQLNTVLGSVVGAVPPLIGWSASTGSLSSGSAVIACMLFLWQFPHFNSLNWRLRGEYTKAGYRMMCALNPYLFHSITFVSSALLLPLCSLGAYSSDLLDGTDRWFQADSLIPNLIMIHLAARFSIWPDAKKAQSLFLYSLWYLPSVLSLLALSVMAERRKKHRRLRKIDAATH